MKAKTSKQKGNEGERFVKELAEAHQYICDVHPRTFKQYTRPDNKTYWMSSENDFFGCGDLICVSKDDALMPQVTHAGNEGHKPKDMDNDFPIDNPNFRLVVFKLWKEPVKINNRKSEKYFYSVKERIERGIWLDVSWITRDRIKEVWEKYNGDLSKMPFPTPQKKS